MSDESRVLRFAVSVSREDVPLLDERKLRAELLHYKARDLGLLPSGTSTSFDGVAFVIEVDSSPEKRKDLGDFILLIIKYKGFMEEEIFHRISS